MDLQTQEAKNEILSILNSPDSVSTELITRELEKSTSKRMTIEANLNNKLLGYFQNIELSEKLIKQCEKKRSLTKMSIKDLDNIMKKFNWAKYPQIRRLISLRKNLRQCLDTLHDFLNISSQMKNLKEMMKDPKYYEHLHNKLLMISNLKDAMGAKVQKNPSLAPTFKNFKKHFNESDELKEQFYELVLDNIEHSLELINSEPNKVIKSVKVIEFAELTKGEKETSFFEKSRARLKMMVKRRFEERLEGNEDNIGKALEIAKFSVDDLLEVHLKLIPIFPKKYNIFELLQAEYKRYVERLILPHIEDLDKLKEEPGTVIIFLHWLDGYEELLKRAGIGSNDYADLKDKVKKYIPYYMTHIEGLIHNSTNNMVQMNKEDKSPEALAELLEENDTLETLFPEDLFKYFNQQLRLLGEKVSPDILLNILSVWADKLSDVFVRKTEENCRDVTPDTMLSLPVDINDLNKCMLYLAESKGFIQGIIPSSYHQETTKIFVQIIKALNTSLQISFDKIVKVLFSKIEEFAIENIFRKEWLEAEIMDEVIVAVNSQIENLRLWLVNPMHHVKCLRISAERLVNVYLERFVNYAKLLFPKKKFLENHRCAYYCPLVAQESDKKEKLKVFKDMELVRSKVKQDVEAIQTFIEEHRGSFSGDSAEKLQDKIAWVSICLGAQVFEILEMTADKKSMNDSIYGFTMIASCMFRSDVQDSVIESLKGLMI